MSRRLELEVLIAAKVAANRQAGVPTGRHHLGRNPNEQRVVAIDPPRMEGVDVDQ